MSEHPLPGHERHVREQLSALMDGELDGERSRFLLRRLEADDGLRRTWSRWQVAASAMRGDAAVGAAEDLLDQVKSAIAPADPAEPESPAPARLPPLMRWAGMGAAAAGVAALALIATGPVDRGVPIASPPIATVAPPASSASVAASPLTEADLRPRLLLPAQPVAVQQRGPLLDRPNFQPPADPHVKPYLLLHEAHLRDGGLGAFMPYVEVVNAGPPHRRVPVGAERR